jgi:hypothetical protein
MADDQEVGREEWVRAIRARLADKEEAAKQRPKGANGKAAPWPSDQEISQAKNPDQPSLLPTIEVVAGARHIAADQGLRALVDAGVSFYQRDKKIVRITLVKAKNSAGEIFQVPGIVPVTPPGAVRGVVGIEDGVVSGC